MQKISIHEVILVEGKYDVNHLKSRLDATILSTGGFEIFKNKEKLELFKALAEKRGIILLTDSDNAGFLIRNYLKGALPKEQVFHVYIPDLYGKESRKKAASKEGKIGVEGMPIDLLVERITACVGKRQEAARQPDIEAIHFYEDGLSGGANSGERRRALLLYCGLPTAMTAKQMLYAFRILYTYNEYKKHLNACFFNY